MEGQKSLKRETQCHVQELNGRMVQEETDHEAASGNYYYLKYQLYGHAPPQNTSMKLCMHVKIALLNKCLYALSRTTDKSTTTEQHKHQL